MRKIVLVLIGVMASLAAGTVRADDALAKSKGCLACHTVDKQQIGPAYKEVAKKYAGQKGAEAKIAETIMKGTPAPAGVGWQKAGLATVSFMPPNASVKPDEAQKLAKWILQQK